MRTLLSSSACLLAGILFCASCSSTPRALTPQEGDARDDTFLAGGKSDSNAVEEGSPEACAVLRLVREASPEELGAEIGLDRAAVDGIVAARGHQWIGTLAALDAIPYVGTKAFGKLRAWAASHAEYACGVIDVQVLAINDLHGNLEPPSGFGGTISVPKLGGGFSSVKAGGIEYLATHLRNLVAAHPYSTVVSAGDLIGASPLLSALFHDEPTIEAMNLLQMDYSAAGNHELDEGVAELRRMQSGGCHPADGCKAGGEFPGASFRFLAANVRETATGNTLFPAYELRAFRGARVAFIGVSTRATPSTTLPANIAGIEFADEVDTVNALIPEIRAQGVETIVVILHEGGSTSPPFNGCVKPTGAGFDIARKLDPAVDVVVTGHSHASYVCDIDGKIVTSAASNGRLITGVLLAVDERTGVLVSRKADNHVVTRNVEPDADLGALLGRYGKVAGPLANRVTGTIADDLTRSANAAGESALGDVIADAQLAATAAADRGAARIAFMNPYGIRADLIASQISGGEKAGEVTYAEAFAVQPFSNGLVTLTLTGAQLDTLLEQQFTPQGQMILSVSAGFSYSWRDSAPLGDRVSDLRLHGVPVDPAQAYRVTMNAFVAGGGDGFAVATEGTDLLAGPIDLDALDAYLGKSSPIAPPATDRIHRLP